jgi:hypothetical protein
MTASASPLALSRRSTAGSRLRPRFSRCAPGGVRLLLLAAIAFGGLATTAIASDAPTPTIEHTDDWRAAVRQFAEANLKHPTWGASHRVRDYELAKVLAAADHVTLDDDVLHAAAYLHDVAAIAPFRKQFLKNLRAETADIRTL